MITIGCAMTNQPRKDWGLAAAISATLMERLKGEVKFWWHTDLETRHWSLNALIADFQLSGHVEITYPPVDDTWLAEQYRKCDVTILPSLGEGFGYPWLESIACGTPCVHGNYAGGASIIETCGLPSLLVEPRAWRLEGQFNCLRPVFEPGDFVEYVIETAKQPKTRLLATSLAETVEHLQWSRLGSRWRKWFREGL